MFKILDILDEKDVRLHEKCEEVTFPLTKEEKKLVENMLIHLEKSQIEEIAEKYDLRPGMGLAAPQVGVMKRFFVVCEEQEDGSFEKYQIFNPKIISNSEELVFVGGGEGCLSVNREVEGIIPRYARITISYQDIDGIKRTKRVREETAIAFQHEMDHLNGVLFTDKINKENPFDNEDNMRMI